MGSEGEWGVTKRYSNPTPAEVPERFINKGFNCNCCQLPVLTPAAQWPLVIPFWKFGNLLDYGTRYLDSAANFVCC